MARVRFISNSYQLAYPGHVDIDYPPEPIYARVDWKHFWSRKKEWTELGNYTLEEFKQEIEDLFRLGAAWVRIRFIDGDIYEQELLDLRQ